MRLVSCTTSHRVGEPDYDAGDEKDRIAPACTLADHGRLVRVFNKADAAPHAAQAISEQGMPVSAKTGEGLDALRRKLLELAGWHASPEGLFIARTRHVQALRRTREHLAQAQAQADSARPALDLLAEEFAPSRKRAR